MKKNKNRIRKPVMEWQTGQYEQKQTITFEFPPQFLMICKLAAVTPEQLLSDFIDNLSNGTWQREGRQQARLILTDYFIEHGYANDIYTPQEIRAMFAELDAMASLFPKNGNAEELDAYSTWRSSHQQYWFKKWLGHQ
jgi:hypothetical protein